MSDAENGSVVAGSPATDEPQKKKLKVDDVPANGSAAKNGSGSAEASEDSNDSIASDESANGSAAVSEDGDASGKTADDKKKFVRPIFNLFSEGF